MNVKMEPVNVARTTLIDFYKDSQLWLPNKPQSRVWRFQNYDGAWKRNFVGVDYKRLRKCLLDTAAKTVYFSTIMYLNPLVVREKKDVKGQRICGAEIVFDFDSESITLEDLEKTRKRTLLFYRFIIKYFPELKIKYITFSGGKGFHIMTDDPNSYSLLKRGSIKNLQKKRNIYISKILRLWKLKTNINCPFDYEISRDVNRFIRCPQTVNVKTGYLCTILPDVGYLKLPIKELLELIPFVGKVRPRIPVRREMTNSLQCKRKDGGKPAGLRFHHQSFMTNKVIGLKDRLILILKYPAKDIILINKRLKFLQKKYLLSDFFVFMNELWVYAVNLKTMQESRINKILKYSKAYNSTEQSKFTRLRMPVTDRKDNYGNIIEKQPKFVGTVGSEIKDHFVSAGHYNFMKKFDIDVPDYKNMHGNEKEVGITKSIIEVR